VWEVRFSEMKGGKRYQRTEILDPALYRTKKDLRKTIELTISQVNAGTAGEKADAKFGAVTNLYRAEHLPTLAHSTRQVNSYLLTKYIEERFGRTPIRDIKPLSINEWKCGRHMTN